MWLPGCARVALAVQVETLDRYFENVCELDIMFNLEKVTTPQQLRVQAHSAATGALYSRRDGADTQWVVMLSN